MRRAIKLFLSLMMSFALLNSINVFADTFSTGVTVQAPIVSVLYNSTTQETTNNTRVVKVTIGSNVANVDGQSVTMNAVPYVQEYTNVTMIPLRFVATALGIPDSDIIYDAEAKRVTINANKRFNEIDKVTYFLNASIGNYGYAELKEGVTYIPLRALCNALSLSLEWDSNTKTATMTVDNSLASNTSNTTTNSTQSTTTTSTSTTLTEQEIRAMEEEVVRLVNEERAKYGLQPLEISEKLMETAKIKAEDMATRNYFSHTDPDGYTLYQQIENLNNFWTIMENCHAGSNTAGGAVNGWMNSTKGHREQILTPEYKYVGVGYVKNLDSEYTNYWVIHFSSDDKWSNSSSYTLK